MSYFKTNKALKAQVNSLESAIEESLEIISRLASQLAISQLELQMDKFDASLKPKKKPAKKATKAPAKKAVAKKAPVKKVAPKK